MTRITKEAIEAAKSAYWHEAHNGGGYSDKCYEAALTAALPFLPIAGEGKVEPAQPDYGYMRVVEVFDRNVTAGAFLSEDGEGGFAAGVSRMADEIDRLRRNLAEASSPGKDGGQEVEPAQGTPEWHMWVGGYGPDFLAGWKAARSYPQPASTALVEAREAFCGMAEWLFQRKGHRLTKADTDALFAECQTQRLALDKALSASQSTSTEGER